MKHTQPRVASTALFCASLGLLGCGTAGDEVQSFANPKVAARSGTVVIDGCSVDASQVATLSTPAAKRVISEVIIRCGSIQPIGAVDPSDAAGRASLDGEIGVLKGLGYVVRVAVRLIEDTPVGPVVQGAEDPFGTPGGRATAIDNLLELPRADGLEVDLRHVPAVIAGDEVTAFIAELRQRLGTTSYLGVLVPSASDDVLASVAQSVSHVRLMTIDFSTPDSPGPGTDSGWAVDALRAASAHVAPDRLDIALPLLGTDFVDTQMRPITFTEGMRRAGIVGTQPERGPTGALHLESVDGSGGHEIWFDDKVSITRALAAWDGVTLPPSVGVVYYGLGGEDPGLWDAIAWSME